MWYIISNSKKRFSNKNSGHTNAWRSEFLYENLLLLLLIISHITFSPIVNVNADKLNMHPAVNIFFNEKY